VINAVAGQEISSSQGYSLEFDPLEDCEIRKATEEIFAACRRSVLHRHSVLLSRLVADSNRSVFETTDDKIEDALNISLAFAGGFKKGVTKQIQDVSSSLDELRKLVGGERCKGQH
jgi:hypothetical protein